MALIILLLLLQFIRIERDNPSVDPDQDAMLLLQAPAEIASMIRRACYDCHSHHSVYPWYTHLAPISFWIKRHINKGRQHLNFSTWGAYSRERAHHKLEECYEEVLEGHMPLPSYIWMHQEAKLTPAERRDLAEWFQHKMPEYRD